jgi:hypothetical protein
MIGIVMGAASLAAVLALGDGAERFARSQVEREGMNLVVVQPITDDVFDGLRVPRQSFPVFQPDDVAKIEAVTGEHGSVVLHMDGTGLMPDAARKRGVRIRAIFATRPETTLPLSHGRPLSAEEMRDGPSVPRSRRPRCGRERWSSASVRLRMFRGRGARSRMPSDSGRTGKGR